MSGVTYSQQTRYPTKPVRLVTVGPGSQNDILARLICPKVSEAWGQPIVIENRTGAGGAIAFARGKATPILFSSAGAGSGMHMNAERFRLVGGFKGQHVAFKSSPEAVIEVVTGRVQYAMPGLGPALPFIKDGRLIALAVANPQRSPLLPDVPAITEALPDYARDGSFGILAPAGTPRPILNQISREVKRALELPDIRARLDAMGFIAMPSTPEEFDKIVRADIQTFKTVGKAAGLITR